MCSPFPDTIRQVSVVLLSTCWHYQSQIQLALTFYTVCKPTRLLNHNKANVKVKSMQKNNRKQLQFHVVFCNQLYEYTSNSAVARRSAAVLNLLHGHTRDHIMLCVNKNLLRYCKTVWKIASDKACNRWMTLKITQGHQHWCNLIGHISLLISCL